MGERCRLKVKLTHLDPPPLLLLGSTRNISLQVQSHLLSLLSPFLATLLAQAGPLPAISLPCSETLLRSRFCTWFHFWHILTLKVFAGTSLQPSSKVRLWANRSWSWPCSFDFRGFLTCLWQKKLQMWNLDKQKSSWRKNQASRWRVWPQERISLWKITKLKLGTMFKRIPLICQVLHPILVKLVVNTFPVKSEWRHTHQITLWKRKKKVNRGKFLKEHFAISAPRPFLTNTY